jgi:hypothetical protein
MAEPRNEPSITLRVIVAPPFREARAQAPRDIIVLSEFEGGTPMVSAELQAQFAALLALALLAQSRNETHWPQRVWDTDLGEQFLGFQSFVEPGAALDLPPVAPAGNANWLEDWEFDLDAFQTLLYDEQWFVD